MDPRPERDLIRPLKPDAVYILRQFVGILPQHTVESHPVSIVDFCGQRAGNSVFLQKKHCVPQILLLLHLNTDLPGDPLGDSPHFRKALRFLFHNAQRVRPESFHDA